jgi:starch synthase
LSGVGKRDYIILLPARAKVLPNFLEGSPESLRGRQRSKAQHRVVVLFTHTWYESMAGFLAKKLYNVPFVLTTHSLESLRAWKAEQLGSGYATSSWMERTAILEADAVIAVSKGTKADILRAYPLPEERIHVIYNGVDLEEYRKTLETTALTAYGVDASRPYMLFVGRITRLFGRPTVPRWSK